MKTCFLAQTIVLRRGIIWPPSVRNLSHTQG